MIDACPIPPGVVAVARPLSIGLVKPNSLMLAAICATCASLCVRLLRA